MLKGSVSWFSDDGDKFWYKDLHSSVFHRTDGPAIEWADGNKEWWFNGKKINCNSQKEFERYLNLISFI